MATIPLVFGFCHSPYLFAPPDLWPALRGQIRQGADVRPDVPRESAQELRSKHARCQAAFARLRDGLARAGAQALILVGDDQGELFRDLAPPFAVFRGAAVTSFREPHRLRAVTGDDERLEVPGHAALATGLVHGLGRRGFDVTWVAPRPGVDLLVGHAFGPPLGRLLAEPLPPLPVVPIMVNCYFPPAPAAARCYAFGQALRESLAELDHVERAAVGCSGGLWHTPGQPDAMINEVFDRQLLADLGSGHGRALAALDDAVLVSGTGEVRNWIVGAGMTGETPWTIVDYVPLYYSPIGAGFALCEATDGGLP